MKADAVIVAIGMRSALPREQAEGGHGVVRVPHVLAEQAPEREALRAHRGGKLLDRPALFDGELAQVEEVAAVVELAVVGQERLDDEGVGAVSRRCPCAVVGDEDRLDLIPTIEAGEPVAEISKS
jgi:hypothetical protein